MPEYESGAHDPPAPVATVVFANAGEPGRSVSVKMLLDSGADVSVVAEWVLAAVGSTEVPDLSYSVTGFGGTPADTPVARLTMTFGEHTYRGLFLVGNGETGIIGRNILNTLDLALYGTGLRWEILRRAT